MKCKDTCLSKNERKSCMKFDLLSKYVEKLNPVELIPILT